eukprot:2578542-Prymnesium_polylepis.1
MEMDHLQAIFASHGEARLAHYSCTAVYYRSGRVQPYTVVHLHGTRDTQMRRDGLHGTFIWEKADRVAHNPTGVVRINHAAVFRR